MQEGVAVVMDVLRATSTIVHALAAGAECVIPCGTIDDARRLAAKEAPGTFLLGGEREGLMIPGFDLGNSPTDYSPAVVAGKKIIFTTTNGTVALIRAKEARRVLIGALTNLNAVVELLTEETGPVHLVCAGTNGHMTLEDVLCAGGIVHWLSLAATDADARDDAAQLALGLFDACGQGYDRVHEDRVLATLSKSRGGRNLIDCGLAADIAICAEQDKFDIVPELSRQPWEIRLARMGK